jgi:toxin ParE1/3/4
MARIEVRWTERALDELQGIGEYIALDNPEAASRVIKRVFTATDRLQNFPRSGKKIAEFPLLSHRELVVPPCRVFYRIDGSVAWIVHVVRSERIIRKSDLAD